MIEIELFDLLTVCINKMCLQIIYSIYMLKHDLALSNQQGLTCQKTKPIETIEDLRRVAVSQTSVKKPPVKTGV